MTGGCATSSADRGAVAIAAIGTDWPGYHFDAAHTGYAPAVPAATALGAAWRATLDGPVQAAPLVVHGLVIAATENNTVYGLNGATGRVVWSRHLATPVTSGLPCGNIHPLGITGTPVYDAASDRILAVTTSPTARSIRHVLVGLRPATGAQVLSTLIDPVGSDPLVENQRGALNLSRGRVLVPFGGHAGDCGNYHGWLVSARAVDGGGRVAYRTGTAREAGMWQPSGAAVDGAGSVYEVTGNGSVTAGRWDGGNAVSKYDPVALHRLSYFVPSDWASGNATDSDLGSAGATLVGSHVFVQGKSATGYLLNAANLGGIGHPVRALHGVCEQQFGGSAVHGSSVFAACTNGIRHLVVRADGTAVAGWRAPANVTGSPVVGGGRVWSLDPGAGVLYSLDERTGSVAGRIAVGRTVRFATPALSGRLILVPTVTGITAVSGA